jgi:two-component system chemotaxis sensor kinase CheA
MDDMLKDFVVEALDLAVKVEEYLLKLEKSPGDMEALNAVFRSFHTIKGGAGFMDLETMVSACHLTENLFDALRTGQAPVSQMAIDAALEASGFVADQLEKLANGASIVSLQPLPPALEQRLLDSINPGAADPGAREPARLEASPDAPIDWEAYFRAVVPAQAMPAGQKLAAWDGVERRQAPAEDLKGTVKEDSIRIDSGKLDALLEVAGESVQAVNQASVLLEKLMQHPFEGVSLDIMKKLAETLARGGRYATELQHASLSARMQPVGRLFQKFPRLVRELARELGKEVELAIEGAETEVDRVVVEGLYDPLVHMLRNALDHGIENREQRMAAGKSGKAEILLKAWQEGNSIMIELSDDGRGIDAAAIRAKAIAKGLIEQHAAQSEEEACKLIFLPGFSTKEVASSVSGRGVGMDVVKTAVEKHRGTVAIHSRLGHGTRFLIQLPIELSIVPTMLVSTAGAALGIPMSLVERVVELPKEMKGVIGSPVFMDQGRPLAVKSLAGVLRYQDAAPEPIGVVINAPAPYILAVESVEGTADLVIKPLTAMNATGISGTARSAEGELVLIVSISFILNGCK